jgi:hypothetical protein
MFDLFQLFKPIPHPAVLQRNAVISAAAVPPKPAPIPAAAPTASAAQSQQVIVPAALPIPDQALTFVENEEDGSASYYVAHYEHWDWPGGVSGPTAGVGYDFGQVTHEEAQADWTGIVDPATLGHMLTAVGLQGARAEEYCREHRSEITVTWDQGIAEFKQREVPKWLVRCRAALPNFDTLPGLCQGALFSLSYNRGTGGYIDPGSDSHNAEMRAIRRDMIAKNFAAIPALIESMVRLWPTVKDLRDRRAHEAALFRQGLAAAAAEPTAV